MTKSKLKKIVEPVKPVEEIKPVEPVEPVNDNEVLKEKLQEVINDTQDLQTNEPEQKKRGRPKKIDKPIEENKPIVIPIAPIIDIIVQRLPNPIPLSNTEKEYINDAGNKLAEKYSTNIKYLEEIQFSVLLFGVIYPRLKKPEISN